jgi:hypothetical protein
MVRKLKVRGIDSLSDLSQAIYDTTGYGVRQALDGKQTILVPGVTIKTINGQSIVGPGDITISAGGTPGCATTQLQFNNAGVFAGSADIVYDSTNRALVVNSFILNGGTEALRINSSGAISLGASGTNFGTAGQLMASAGNAAPPTWLTATAARETLNTGDFTPLTAGLQLAVGGVYSGDTTAAALTVQMPSYANSKLGSRIVIFNTRYNWVTNNLIVQVGSEHIIRNVATDLVCDSNFDAITLVCTYKDGTKAHWNIL